QTNHTRKELLFLMFKEINLRNHSSLHKLFYSLDFITYINQDYLKNYGYVISDKIYQEEKAKLESNGIDFYFYSKYLNCNNDQQLYNYFRKMISQMNKVILESINQVN
ncbi:MAG: hypothetical protein E6643_04075, partial [Lactobacillus crispatus]|nr:hypothetical protein [Lactobacillus crispatus]